MKKFIFDVDGTLTPSRQPICPSFLTFFSDFISDNDVYMEFDDRWAHQGNYVSTAGDEYVNTGYPLGITVRMEAHSYGVSFAEDIMFITVRVKNESGDYINDDVELISSIFIFLSC